MRSLPEKSHGSSECLADQSRIDTEREKAWQLIEEIGRRNAHIDPDEAERDIAEAIAEVRAERDGTE